MKPVIGLDVSALDPQFKEHAQRGIGRYVSELVRFFESRGEKSAEDKVEVAPFDHGVIEQQGGSALKAASAVVRCSPVLRTTLKQQLLYPFQLSRVKGSPWGGEDLKHIDALHFPAQMDAPAWGLSKYALTVLDLIPIVCADLYKAKSSGLRFKFARWLELQAIKNASIVLCISAHTARDVNAILGIPWERLVVTPLGVDKKFFAVEPGKGAANLRTQYGLGGLYAKRPIVLYVGGIDPRKNVGVMLRAFAEVLQHFRSQPGLALPVLVMAGRIAQDREYPELQRLIQELGLQDDVVQPGFVPDEDLLKLYGASSVFFFPSLYEGFGLPPLEALAAGLPVVSSDASAMPEVLGDAAVFFNPANVSEAAQGLVSVLTDNHRAQRLAEEGRERAQLFTWEKTGQATLHAYERLGALLRSPTPASRATSPDTALSVEEDLA